MEGVCAADRGGLTIFGFFFLFEIEGEEKEDEADGFIGGPLAESLEPAVAMKIGLRIDLDAMITDDRVEVRFGLSGKFRIAYVHIQFHAGVCADPVDII